MRKILALVVLGLAALPLPAGASPAADQVVRTVHREYGDGPVRLGRAQVVVVRFEGRRGDRVRLDGASSCAVRLAGPAGHPVPPSEDGFWRLADRGRQTFTFTRCAAVDGSSKLQLQKLRPIRVPVDGSGTRLPAQRGYVDAYRVRVPAHGRLQARFVRRDADATVEGMVLPNGGWYEFGGAFTSGSRLFFEDGRPIYHTFGRLRGAGGHGALVMHAGDVVTVVTRGPGTAYESKAAVVPFAVDAPATVLPPSPVPYRDYELDVGAVAGQWLHAEVVGPTGGPYEPLVLIGPNGHQFLNHEYWRIPTTGRYRLMVPTAPTTASTQVRIRTIRVLGTPMPVDGTHVTLATTQPGEWVLVPMTLAESSLYRLTSHAATATGPWTAVATLQGELHCDQRSNGCGEFSAGYVSPTTPVSGEFGGYGAPATPWMVLLQPEPGVTASVELSVDLRP